MEEADQRTGGAPGEGTPRSPLGKMLCLLPIRKIRKLVVLVVGGTVLLIGVLMIIGPGPATLVIPAGLAILAIEFAWARRLLKRGAEIAENQKKKLGFGSAKTPNENEERPK